MSKPNHSQHSDRPDKPDRPGNTDRHDRPYRIESNSPARSSLLPAGSTREFYRDRGLAVAVAVKSLSDPTREQVRVVHVPSGEVVFESEAPQRPDR
jgi:hypothetical protein